MRSLPIVVSLAAACAAALALERADPARGFAIDVPDGFGAVEREDGAAHVLRLATADGLAFVEVHATPLPASATADLAGALRDFEDRTLRRAADVERVACERRPFRGADAIVALYRSNDEAPWSHGVLIAARGGWTYALWWASQDDSGAALAEKARAAAESFRPFWPQDR